MFTGQAKEFPSLCGQLCGDCRRSSLTLFCLWLFLQLIPHCAATGWPTRGQGGGGRSSSNTCLTLHCCRHPSVRPRFLPSLGPRLRRSLRHNRCHHVRLFPPGLSQLARCLLWDEWVSLSLRSLLSSPPLVFSPYDFARSPQSNSPIEQQGSVVQWERFCLRSCVWWRQWASVWRLVLMLSCVADLQWVLGVSAERRGVFEDVIIERMSGSSAFLSCSVWSAAWKANRPDIFTVAVQQIRVKNRNTTT